MSGILAAKGWCEMAKSDTTPEGKFNKALAAALAVSRSEIQGRLAQAKDEKPSPHTKYTYAPAEARS